MAARTVGGRDAARQSLGLLFGAGSITYAATCKETRMLISPAWAQAAGGGGSDALVQILPLVLIFVVFYFLLIRPQQKKAKEHKEMLSKIRRGDRIVTGGGIVGTVAKAPDGDEIAVDIAENVRIKVIRATISAVIARSEPAGRDDDAEEKPKVRAAGGK
jgi:preprotein translocase subunit YajC